MNPIRRSSVDVGPGDRVTTASATGAGRALVSSWGLFAALGLVMIGNGLLGVVIGVRSEGEGFSTLGTGLIMAAYFAGFLLGSQAAQRLMLRVGHVRTFTGLASLVAGAALLHGLWVAPLPWMVLRLLFGFAMAGLYVVAESWLNETVTNANRGRVMAMYMVVSMGGLGAGQMLLGVGDPMRQTLFLLAGIVLALSVAPVSLSIGDVPVFHDPPRRRAREIWDAAPVGIVTALGSGVANGALIGMAGVYAAREGLPPGRTAIFVGAAALGSVVLQWPLGLLSDVIGRRRSILLVTTAAVVAGTVAVGLSPSGWPMVAAMFVFGGMSFPMYSLALSHVVDVLPRGAAATGSVAVVFATGVGSILGPIAASLAMGWFGNDGFFWTMTVVHAVVGVYVAMRLTFRPVIADLTPADYVPVPARSTYLLDDRLAD
jgi:MFS family permease